MKYRKNAKTAEYHDSGPGYIAIPRNIGNIANTAKNREISRFRPGIYCNTAQYHIYFNTSKTALFGTAYDWVFNIGIYCNTAE